MTDHPCPCRYDHDMGAIVSCDLHGAAGELLEACNLAIAYVANPQAFDEAQVGMNLAEAIMRARGQSKKAK